MGGALDTEEVMTSASPSDWRQRDGGAGYQDGHRRQPTRTEMSGQILAPDFPSSWLATGQRQVPDRGVKAGQLALNG